MELEKLKRSLESAAAEILPTASLDALPTKFFQAFVLQGLRVDTVEPGRLLCALTIPARLLNTGGFLHGGATASLVDLVGSAAFYTAGAKTSGAPVEISISYLDAAFLHFLQARWFVVLVSLLHCQFLQARWFVVLVSLLMAPK